MRYDEDIEEACREKWGKLVADLNESNREFKKQRDRAYEKLEQRDADAEAGRAFLAMMKAVRENDAVKHAWDRFMMTLRMTGYDKS